MNKTPLYALWGGMFILCAGLGFIPEPAGALRIVMILLSIGFFAVPALLLHQAVKEGDKSTIALIRNLSAASLLVTLVCIVVNFMSLMASEALGNILYAILIIVSSPMICGQYWVLSLFLWACLLMVCLSQLRKKG